MVPLTTSGSIFGHLVTQFPRRRNHGQINSEPDSLAWRTAALGSCLDVDREQRDVAAVSAAASSQALFLRSQSASLSDLQQSFHAPRSAQLLFYTWLFRASLRYRFPVGTPHSVRKCDSLQTNPVIYRLMNIVDGFWLQTLKKTNSFDQFGVYVIRKARAV